ncbi:cold-shock protein [Aliivibrio finisterrensis]|uniref:Cold-shock protein n=1 Tax=Aliivibrio finisterrensis TaxID=511998 RepID=A0A4Q5K730_9GAMM|nr:MULTISPECIES: cold shock domain-containing protein [Aliivibrio]MDD9177109.1 cold shock domain-containing protein [Aliivibrio sp. S3TY1]MDD9194186.1 cold shock domain-containing protein [Aliivibrio sp. S2TY2]MUJ20628.1 cold-shock protein [Aliivibrio fischeri]OCH35245.1 cold-shock protein [Aliivibrio fischeri]RYU40425.1 cold-shock protein [Aliivibrio finisterrensis]
MKGKIIKWVDDRGFGFIQSHNAAGEIFAHISQFKKGYRRPKVGDEVEFQLEYKDDKTNAKLISLVGVQPSKSRSSFVTKILVLAVITIGILGYQFFSESNVSKNDSAPLFDTTPAYENMGFSCDGKTYCSEMKSCDEAKFYIANCPNTKMDGNGDGVPCESQHCNF